jgi:hypothetical protein
VTGNWCQVPKSALGQDIYAPAASDRPTSFSLHISERPEMEVHAPFSVSTAKNVKIVELRIAGMFRGIEFTDIGRHSGLQGENQQRQ